MILQGLRERSDGELVQFKAPVDAGSAYRAVQKFHEQLEEPQDFIVKEAGSHSIP